ncbi:MAG: ATP-binding protein [Spirochaetia bacterium]
MDLVKRLFQYGVPPWVMRFVKTIGKGINKFDMIRSEEKVLLGVSGGKDSLACALALALRKRWLPIDYELEAMMIEWEEHPPTEQERQKLYDFFDAIGVPLAIHRATMFPDSFQNTFNCYLCSRNRKRILFNEAGKRGITRIALGHHMDDIIETTLMNICFQGHVATMLPVQEFFQGKLHIIRPMCEVKANTVERVVERLDIPTFKISCPFHETNLREKLRPIISELAHINKHVRENIYAAPWNIIPEYLPEKDTAPRAHAQSTRKRMNK